MKEILLTQGKIAFVDDDDFERLNQFKWYTKRSRNTFYAVRNIRPQDREGQRQWCMHREVLSIPSGFQTDHIDGNGLNNQKSNLRVVTTRENSQNKHVKKTSRYPGVCRFNGVRKKWQAYIDINGKRQHLGQFTTEDLAYQAYFNACNNLIVRGAS